MLTNELKNEAKSDKDATGNNYGHAARNIDGNEVKCVLNILGKFVFFLNNKKVAAKKIDERF